MYQYLLLALPVAALVCWALAISLKRRGRAQPLIFYGGLTYVLVALPIVWSWYLYIALGSIAVGSLLVVLARFRLGKAMQIVLVLLPMTSFLGYAWYSESSYNIFLIPQGYRGRVVIVHGCRDGAPREFEGRYRVYKIGQDGLLKSRFNFAGNAFDHLHSRYFYVDTQGKRTPIAEDSGPGTVIIQGLWSLGGERKGDTGIDFIVDQKVAEPADYRIAEKDKWQREIEKCFPKE